MSFFNLPGKSQLSFAAVMIAILSVLLAVAMTGALPLGQAAAPAQQPLTFEDREAAQRAIEEVYWKHRILPLASKYAGFHLLALSFVWQCSSAFDLGKAPRTVRIVNTIAPIGRTANVTIEITTRGNDRYRAQPDF